LLSIIFSDSICLSTFFLVITFCIVGSACLNSRLLSSLNDRYVYECINDERLFIQNLNETKHLLAQRQLRIFILDSFDDYLFQYVKSNEDSYTISSELVLSCTEKEIVIKQKKNIFACLLIIPYIV
jgi:hypothetical protein